jgi:hypothetical protein
MGCEPGKIIYGQTLNQRGGEDGARRKINGAGRDPA